jgi:DNA-binding transcriptional ArsR family regulator
MARAATTSDIFNAVAEPQRRRILEVLMPGDRTVTDLARLLCMTQPQASKHLKVLKEVGLVGAREVGKQRLYHLNGDALKPIRDWILTFEELWNERFDQLDELLDELKARDARQDPTP